MCGLWKQKVFNWPAQCAEELQESTTLPNCCWLEAVFAWLCWGLVGPQLQRRAFVTGRTCWACTHRGLERQPGHVEPQPSAWESPLGWALPRGMKALVGAKVNKIKSWVKGLRGRRGLEMGQCRCPALGDSSTCLDETEGSPASGPGLLGPGCCLEMLPFCSVQLCNTS